MLGLILAGEVIFALPFHVTRFFRATFLEAYALTDTQLGTIQGIYGIVAMVAYFPGGPIADRFAPRKLLAISLLITAAGGLYMATMPGYVGACVLWGFFGFSTIFLFWAPLMRATRYWGSDKTQGRAYGILEGGRGAIAVSIAVMATMGLVPEASADADPASQASTLRFIILGYTALTVAAALFVYFAITDTADEYSPGTPASWRQALLDAKGGNEDAVVVLGVFGDGDLPTGICEPFGMGGQVGAAIAPLQREFVDSFNERGFFCSVCADEYAPCFSDAVSVIDSACDDFIPVD